MNWLPTYVALIEPGKTGRIAARVQDAIRACAPHLALRFQAGGLTLLARPGLDIIISPARGPIILGTLCQGPARVDGAGQGNPGCASLEELIERYWGSYLAFHRETGGTWCVLREPGGGRGAFLAGAQAGLVADELPTWLLRSAGVRVTIDRRRLANALAMPTMTSHRSLLSGAEMLTAGCAARWEGGWSDQQLLWKAPGTTPDPVADPDRIRRAVFDACTALSEGSEAALLELSGGLDSAIVLGALRTCRPELRMVAVNLSTRARSGDERAPARTAAARWSTELVEVGAREEDLDFRFAMEGPQPTQRIAYGLDSVLERAVTGVAEAFGADRIFTGQGGDAAFFQFPVPQVAIDLFRDVGLSALWSRAAWDVARRARTSIWSLHWQMLADRWRAPETDRMPATLSFLTAEARAEIDVASGDHPWLGPGARLPPAKRMQLFGIANGQWFNGPAFRRSAADLLHPLLAQPVVEACLAMPAHRLSHGTQDRALARSLFGDLLPASIVGRRAKGDTSAYHRRGIVHNLRFLRSHLLEGALVSANLLDRDALGLALSEEALLWRHDARAVISIASLEAWARHWGL